jgi:hypothetical protein
MKPATEDQHFIPKSYLKGFTEKKVLWVCEQGKSIRASKPKEEANRPDYYTYERDGERDDSTERTLQKIESVVAPTLQKIGNRQFQLTDTARNELYYFTALMFARVPAWREHLDRLFSEITKEQQIKLAQEKDKFYASLKDFEINTGKTLDKDYEQLRQWVLKGEYEIKQTSVGFNLRSMFESVQHVAEMLLEYDYQLLYAPKDYYFVTSDTPVLTILPQPGKAAYLGVGFGLKRTEAYFPLNKRVCLRLKRDRKSAEKHELHIRAIESLNRTIMANASKYLYCPQGHKRTQRLFEEFGCKSKAGENAFMKTPPNDVVLTEDDYVRLADWDKEYDQYLKRFREDVLGKTQT